MESGNIFQQNAKHRKYFHDICQNIKLNEISSEQRETRRVEIKICFVSYNILCTLTYKNVCEESIIILTGKRFECVQCIIISYYYILFYTVCTPYCEL